MLYPTNVDNRNSAHPGPGWAELHRDAVLEEQDVFWHGDAWRYTINAGNLIRYLSGGPGNRKYFRHYGPHVGLRLHEDEGG